MTIPRNGRRDRGTAFGTGGHEFRSTHDAEHMVPFFLDKVATAGTEQVFTRHEALFDQAGLWNNGYWSHSLANYVPETMVMAY